MQEVKEAIGVESRTTIFNPTYIKEQMKGGASSASGFAAIVQNTFGWEVMKPKAIDEEFWNELYDVYIKDKYNLGTDAFFEKQSPAAIEEITAVMLESARKGMWKASREQVGTLAKRHVELVNKYRPSCSGFVCNNAKLRKYIVSSAPDKSSARLYDGNIEKIRQGDTGSKQGMKMQRENLSQNTEQSKGVLSNVIVGIVVVVVLVGLIFIVRRNRNQRRDGEK